MTTDEAQVTVPEAARLLGRDPNSVYRYIRGGQLPAVATDYGLRVPRSSVLSFRPRRPTPPRGLRGTGVAADIRREHPDWTDEQGRAEYKRRMRERDRARNQQRKAEAEAAELDAERARRDGAA